MAQLLKRINLNVNWRYLTCGNKVPARFIGERSYPNRINSFDTTRPDNRKNPYRNNSFNETHTDNRGYPSRIISFDEIQEERRKQALRSILFVYRSSKENLLKYCSTYGRIGNAYFFKRAELDPTSNNSYQQLALIEFSSTNVVDRVLDGSKHFPNARRIPMRSQNLFYAQNYSKQGLTNNNNIRNIPRQDINNYGMIDLSDGLLMDCQSIDEQMDALYKKQSLSEIDIRLRYFIAAEVENLSRRLYPMSKASLFGSTVTGLGRYNGDVDITLDIEPHNPFAENGDGAMESSVSYFISKIRPENERSFCQGMLDAYGSLMRNMMPQMINVKSILRARVPIVKFKHSSTDLEGDVCISNGEAIEMSRALHHLTSYHPSVLPLIFTIRQWARYQAVTRSNPTPCLSNFMLTLLSVFYLQNHPQILLPSVKDFQQSNTDNKRVKQDISHEDLLRGFFEFYSELDFSQKGISVFEGSFMDIPEGKNNEHSDATASFALYLENPIERKLNAAKIVEKPHLDHFQDACARSLHALSKSVKPNFEHPWGLLTILKTGDVQLTDFEVENVVAAPIQPIAEEEEVSI